MKCEDFAEHPLEPALQRYKKESLGIEIIGLVICVCLHMKTASDCTGIKTPIHCATFSRMLVMISVINFLPPFALLIPQFQT